MNLLKVVGLQNESLKVVGLHDESFKSCRFTE